MKFTFAVTTAFALLTSVCASAIPSIEERTVPSTVDNLPDADVYCKDSSGNWFTISPNTISESIKKAADLQDRNKIIWQYPSTINDATTLPGWPHGKPRRTVWHYPIAETSHGTAVYDGRNYGDMTRVMYTHKKDSDTATFAGIWTHHGTEGNAYYMCGTGTEWQTGIAPYPLK
ncbi:hypothetical protein F4820DRAFT_449149 [Hypoxylon rubiginosum]|uniref:Uncharacterized protein n=1 Tax=Hypoxylon rubiginosum TaxID=110542 RepID=A0ACB9YZ16_9PEZI|nr:hypothetical protein F4820DRAFT_449149 [Hypoxylon rubiginosum]